MEVTGRGRNGPKEDDGQTHPHHCKQTTWNCPGFQLTLKDGWNGGVGWGWGVIASGSLLGLVARAVMETKNETVSSSQRNTWLERQQPPTSVKPVEGPPCSRCRLQHPQLTGLGVFHANCFVYAQPLVARGFGW